MNFSDSDKSNLVNITKEERYKWSMIDAPGDFAWVSVHDLKIAPEYQRSIQPHEVVRFVREWSWLCCGALVVMRRDNDLYVVDGQQRLTAAKKRTDIAQLPCLIFNAKNDLKIEADRFVRLNSCKVGLKGADKYKGSLVAEDPIALKVHDILSARGMKIGQTQSSVTCSGPKNLMTLCEKDEHLFEKSFDLSVILHDGADYNGEIVTGIFYLEAHLRKIGSIESVFSDTSVKKLKACGFIGLKKSINQAKAYWQTSGYQVRAQGVLDVINKGKRDRIPGLL